MSLNPPTPTAFPVVKINSSTGSNTAASGAGPSTALSGTAAATASSTTVTLLVDNPNLSGVATDGTACLWVGSSSGRQFSKITNVNNTAGVKTVTVANAYANTESGKNWGIGGKRLSAAGSSQVFADWGLGWWVDQQTNETISSSITVTAPTPDQVTSAPLFTSTTTTNTWGSQPVIDSTTNSLVMFKIGTTGLSIANLSFKQTSGTPGVAMQALAGLAVGVSWSGCIFDGFSQAIDCSNAVSHTQDRCIVEGNEIKNCTGASGGTCAVAMNINGSGEWAQIINNYFHGNVGSLILGSSGSGITGGVLEGNVFANESGSSGPIQIAFGNAVIKNNTIYNCGSGTSAAAITNLSSASYDSLTLENNIFYGCPGYAIAGTNTIPATFINRNNAYGGNNGGGTGLDRTNFPAGASEVALLVSPFNSSTDYGLNSAATGGALCKGAAAGVPNASANPSGDLGAIPSGGGAASGGFAGATMMVRGQTMRVY